MCKRGETEEVIIDGKSISIDSCIFKLVQELNDKGIRTLSSCCGHGKYPSTIIIKGGKSPYYKFNMKRYGRKIVIPRNYEWFSKKEVLRGRKFYEKDNKGLHFLPEVSPEAIRRKNPKQKSKEGKYTMLYESIEEMYPKKGKKIIPDKFSKKEQKTKDYYLTKSERQFVACWSKPLKRRLKGCDFREVDGNFIEVKSNVLSKYQASEMKKSLTKGDNPILALVRKNYILIFRLEDCLLINKKKNEEVLA